MPFIIDTFSFRHVYIHTHAHTHMHWRTKPEYRKPNSQSQSRPDEFMSIRQIVFYTWASAIGSDYRRDEALHTEWGQNVHLLLYEDMSRWPHISTYMCTLCIQWFLIYALCMYCLASVHSIRPNWRGSYRVPIHVIVIGVRVHSLRVCALVKPQSRIEFRVHVLMPSIRNKIDKYL